VKFAGALMIFTGLLGIMFTIRKPPDVGAAAAAANPTQFAGTSAAGTTTTTGYISGGA
jgi:hypothetical protein